MSFDRFNTEGFIPEQSEKVVPLTLAQRIRGAIEEKMKDTVNYSITEVGNSGNITTPVPGNQKFITYIINPIKDNLPTLQVAIGYNRISKLGKPEELIEFRYAADIWHGQNTLRLLIRDKGLTSEEVSLTENRSTSTNNEEILKVAVEMGLNLDTNLSQNNLSNNNIP